MKCTGGTRLVSLSTAVVAMAVSMALSRIYAGITVQASVLRLASFAPCPLAGVGRLVS